MANFRDMLKTANSSNNEGVAVASSPMNNDIGIMTLDEPYYDGLAYSGEEEWHDDKEKYRWFDNYEDNNYSTVDDKKNIELNENQFNITQEENSQFIPFEMPRYYDGIDLSKTIISIHFTRSDNQHGISDPVNVSYSNEKIRFSWLADSSVTRIAGNIKFEIHATGTIVDSNNNSYAYTWKTRSNKNLNVLQSLCGTNCDNAIDVDESWVQELVKKVTENVSQQIVDAQIGKQVALAENAANDAKRYAENAENAVENVLESKNYATQTYVQDEISKADISSKLVEYALKEEIPTKVSELTNDIGYLTEHQDISGKANVIHSHVLSDITDYQEPDLSDYALKEELPSIEGLATQTYVQDEISKADISSKLVEYAKTENVYTQEQANEKISEAAGAVQSNLDSYKETTDADLQSIHENIDNLPTTLKEDYYDKEATDTLLASKADSSSLSSLSNTVSQVEATANANKTDIQNANTAITSINEALSKIDTSPNMTYEAVYNDTTDENVGENVYVLYEIKNEGKENEERTIKSKFTIVGGSGGSSSANTIKIERITSSPLVVTTDDKVVIEYNFIGTDASGDDIGQGNVTWKLGNKVIKTETVYTGENSADLTEFIDVGSDQKVTLIISDDIGTTQQKIWYVSVVDVKLEASFDDTRYYSANSPVTFTYTPSGAVDKTVHFLMDGKEIATKTSSKAAAGLSDSFTIAAQSHGTHLFEVYMTATINNNDIESNHIVKDIIWFDETSDVPVIGCVSQDFKAKQYETTNIVYTVYDPSTETPSVTLKATYVNEDGETVEEYNSSSIMSSNTDTWKFKTEVIGEHTLTITCGSVVKTLTATIEDIGIEVSPTTAGLEFDFDPVSYSNNSENRIWKDSNTGVEMTVSDNFDWVNGGYQLDENGDKYFCVKAGTTATINHNLFADDAKENGKEFKVIFKTSNVKNRNTSFISCMNDGIGLDMKVESSNIYSSNGSLYSPYCEEDVIEFEFNINKNTDIPMVLTYEDGVGNRPMIYTSDSSFWQTEPQPITIGCDHCDVHIYRMKAYSTSLSDRDILNNFIADARSAEEMIARYKRNQIYKDGALNPEYLAEVCPDLRIIMVDAPWFTNDKDNKVEDTNITMIYKNGDPILDNWTCTGAKHSGQGTSSNEYGYAGRNIDLIMDTDTSLFTLGDGKTTSSTITLTRDSVPTNYLNVKVNIASSENQNNAQMARRYNQFNPFKRTAKLKDEKVKDCMEFYNCVVFIKERDEDVSTHREFQDTNWHYYALGNVGDSKKTDKTRVNDKNDPKECVIEITDYNVPLGEFPTGYGENGKSVCPVSEWKPGNAAYDLLYADYKYKDGKFKSFGSESYEFRYEMKGITEEQRQVNIDNWRDMYKFIATSTDEELYSRLKEYFVIDSVLYFYLFTERYTLVDNRCKNSFWHYGKAYFTQAEAESSGLAIEAKYIDEEQAAIHDGYRWDLTFFYDADTSLGIDNTGKLVLTYGKEDTDYYVDGDPSSSYIYRAAESRFFCKLRDLFKSEMQAMFVDRENANAWSASGLIKQWDDAQSQFPEEIWRLDIQRKYLRTYQGISIDNSKPGEANPRFLVEMLNGRKKYQRRMFERNQELYMATKYFGKTATQDQIMMRFNNPVGATIAPDFTLYITPYSDMYIGVSFGNVTPVNFRAKAGVEYTVPCSIESGTADITLIYGASFIQAIGDLSKCYVGDNDFSKASRLQSLVIGSNANGYANTFMTKISLGNNKLLEYLDIRNITALNSVVDLSNCGNLLELHAEGSGATGVIFANGGKIQKAYIPAITSLTMKNLNNLEEFVIDSYNKLQTLIVEYTPFIDTHEVVNISPILKVLRLAGIDWNIDDTDILNRILTMRGISNTGGEIPMSVLIGNVFVPVVRQQELREFNEAWQDLEVSYNTLIEQYPVTFVNYDGTILDVQYVDKGGNAVDPITRSENPIATPTKESTVSTDFTFAGWDLGFTGIFAARTITATYSESIRKYTITYKSKGVTLQSSTGLYGENVPYTGDIPVYTSEESAYTYYLFDRWDKSGIIDGEKVVNAVFDSCNYNEGYFEGKDLSELRPVEIYAMTKLKLEQKYVVSKDSITIPFGNDYVYDDVESVEIITERTVFNGTNYYDSNINLIDEDKDFVLAIDYKMSGNVSNGVLAQCFRTDGANGFKLFNNSSNEPKLTWGTTTVTIGRKNARDMLVLRHIKGEKGLHVYHSNLDSTAHTYVELNLNKDTKGSTSLVFGCKKADDGVYEDYGIGEIYWAKVWYKDLGDSACCDLVAWTHEELHMEMGGFRWYTLSDGSGSVSSMTFLASHLLDRNRQISPASKNSGGWATSNLRTFMNTRMYNALSVQWRQLIKQVKIKSSTGDVSPDISESNCYLTIPALYSLTGKSSPSVYADENNKKFSHISTATTRIRKYVDGDAGRYWTRSPNAEHANYFCSINDDGSEYNYNYPSASLGILVELSI